jgi:hypothetical protein
VRMSHRSNSHFTKERCFLPRTVTVRSLPNTDPGIAAFAAATMSCSWPSLEVRRPGGRHHSCPGSFPIRLESRFMPGLWVSLSRKTDSCWCRMTAHESSGASPITEDSLPRTKTPGSPASSRLRERISKPATPQAGRLEVDSLDDELQPAPRGQAPAWLFRGPNRSTLARAHFPARRSPRAADDP